MKVFVIPATYNEKENIEKFITVLEEEVFPQIKNHEMHILVADDYSPDGTGDIVKDLMKKYKNLGINQGEKKGLGAAYLRTMGEAIEKHGAEVVVSIDADFQFDPHDLIKFMKKIDEGYFVVTQTRYSGGGSIPKNWPPQRKAFSLIANLFVRSVFMKFSAHDWTGGFRAIRKEVFQKVAPGMENYSGYIFQIAFLHKAIQQGFSVGEVPLHFSDRKLGSSKIASFSYILSVVSYVLIARYHELERIIKFLIVGGTGFIVQFIILHLLNGLGFAQTISTMLSAEAAILLNFYFNNLWTFSDTKHIKQQGSLLRKLIKFNLTSLSAIIIQGLATFVGVLAFGNNLSLIGHTFHTSEIILFPTIILLVIPLNYFIYNKKFFYKIYHIQDTISPFLTTIEVNPRIVHVPVKPVVPSDE